MKTIKSILIAATLISASVVSTLSAHFSFLRESTARLPHGFLNVSVFKSAFFQTRTGTTMISLPKKGEKTWQRTIPI